MIRGEVDHNQVPIIQLKIAGQSWPTLVDTGFNGDLELPMALWGRLPARYFDRTISSLASGVEVEEDLFIVEVPFDGQVVQAEASFVHTELILLGGGLLGAHRLEVNYPDRTVLLERVQSA